MALQVKQSFWYAACVTAALSLAACSPDGGEGAGEDAAGGGGAAEEESQAWEEVGELNGAHLVVVPQDQTADKELYRSAGNSLCTGLGTCDIYFWTDPGMVPQQAPVSDEQAGAMVARYQYKGSTAEEILELNCSVQQEEGCFEQFNPGG